MKAVVNVFKSEVKNKPHVVIQLKTMCTDVSDAPDAYMFTPRNGKLVEFLGVLKFHKVAYGTHFDTKSEDELTIKAKA